MAITRNIELLDEAQKYMDGLDQSTQARIYRNMKRVGNGENDPRIFKKITKTIWEFRTESDGKQHRLLAFWDTHRDTLIVATHGFTKKTQKTPPKEIARADKIREEYFKSN